MARAFRFVNPFSVHRRQNVKYNGRMTYRDDLRERLVGAPWSARRIAKQAGVSSSWVAKAKKGEAYKMSLEMAQRISAAIDDLIEQATGVAADEAAPPPPQPHPGVDAMIALLQAPPKANAKLLAELEALRGAKLDRPVMLPGEALDWALLRLRPPPE